MDIYLVGGAVRDELLGLSIKERDWVVVGVTPEELVKLGYKPVGKDFPVFLHPKTKEEYALARTERKVAPGYAGFVFHADPDVTLEEDLKRRDLTINAIAKLHDNSMIDPFNGQSDIDSCILRHVSPAFSEDPVRILRVARFSARFPNFSVADETMKLMQEMVKSGEVDALIKERSWKECQKALSEEKPQRFFDILEQCGALRRIFPEIADAPKIIDVLKNIKAGDPLLSFAAIFAQTPDPKKVAERIKAPANYKELASICSKLVAIIHENDIKIAETAYNLLKATDAFRRPERFEKALVVVDAILKHQDNMDFNERAEFLKKALRACLALDTTAITQTFSGKAIGDEIAKARIECIRTI